MADPALSVVKRNRLRGYVRDALAVADKKPGGLSSAPAPANALAAAPGFGAPVPLSGFGAPAPLSAVTFRQFGCSLALWVSHPWELCRSSSSRPGSTARCTPGATWWPARALSWRSVGARVPRDDYGNSWPGGGFGAGVIVGGIFWGSLGVGLVDMGGG
ncbi:hypothetical protein VC83_04917 [Pseudogymnoascus destructans]|uniref:Uncharacterized protein n=1 Tax=Pseudogymnoascus destructans TaxID=655981 RepID=A0A177A969_9PEZI|nr:uncharacterized protein VC83_04917 [Pseudogymnoascus destructans]OAF58676.1 hypothetical protein VC83_04917 [Pseudogymnoascus destructans]